MGAVQSIPVIAETVTIIDSGVKLTAACACKIAGEILDNNDARKDADKFLKDAGNTWVEYSERNLIVAPFRALHEVIQGNEKEADRVINKMAKSTEQFLDNTPVIGHVKGTAHYILGDIDHGNDCMKGASRTLAVVGAGVATGGLGGAAVLGGLAGAAGGVGYDLTVSVIESRVKGEDRPYGICASIDQMIKSDEKRDGHGVIDSGINMGYCLVGDFVSGAAAAKTAKSINKSAKQRKALKDRVGNKQAKDVVDAAKKLKQVTEDIDGDSHVFTKVKNLETGEEAYGTNRRCRQQIRTKDFRSKGEASGYTSKTNARKGRLGEFSREAGVIEKAANDLNMDIEPPLDRASRACAEHEAFNNLGTHGAEANIRTCSVTSKNGTITAIKRCDNCMEYGNLMGDVITDSIDGMPVPTAQFTLDTSMAAVKSAVLCGAEAVAICTASGNMDECKCTCECTCDTCNKDDCKCKCACDTCNKDGCKCK